MKESWSYPGSTCEQIKAVIDALSRLSCGWPVRGGLQRRPFDFWGSAKLAAPGLAERLAPDRVPAVRQRASGRLQRPAPVLDRRRLDRPPDRGHPARRRHHPPLQVAYVPGKGDLYLADFGAGHRRVPHLSPPPLAPGDAVAPPPAR